MSKSTHSANTKPTRIKKSCRRCGADIFVKQSHAKTEGIYCSRLCQAEDYRIRFQGGNNPHFSNASHRVCENCGRDYSSYQKKSRFCSVACRSSSTVWRQEMSEISSQIAAKKPKVIHAKQRFLPLRADNRKNHVCIICDSRFRSHKEIQDTCSRTCANRLRYRDSPLYPCAVCGVGFRCAPSKVRYRQRATCSDECHTKHRSGKQKGSKSHRWQGGKTSEAMIIRNSKDYRDWRKSVYDRDDYTCQICQVRGGKLTAHHIREFAKHPELRLTVSNGITLCWPCHCKIKGREEQYEESFYAITVVCYSADDAIRVIENYYGV